VVEYARGAHPLAGGRHVLSQRVRDTRLGHSARERRTIDVGAAAARSNISGSSNSAPRAN
jgi:hypothetical protein